MSDEAAVRRDVLLHEYQEAGAVSRSHAELIRTGLSLLYAVQAGVVGFIATRHDKTSLALRLLVGLGLWLSVVASFNTSRMIHRYKSYMDRAKEIETELGMELYRGSNANVNKSERQPLLSGTYLWRTVPVASGIVFAALLVQMAFASR